MKCLICEATKPIIGLANFKTSIAQRHSVTRRCYLFHSIVNLIQTRLDGRDRYLAALKKVDKASLLAIYKSFILDKNAGQIMIQVRGKQFVDKPFASPEQ